MPRIATAPEPLPQFAHYEAPPHWKCVDFLSDLHLQDGLPRTFDAFAGHLRRTPADAVFILGDLFEVWVGDDARFGAWEGGCVELLSEAARRRPMFFLAGNRDFLVGTELLQTCGVTELSDPTVLSACGRRILLTHGDALCLSDVDYQRFRAQVRQPAWQQAFLARPLAERRAIARQMRDASQEHQGNQSASQWSDLDHETTLAWMRHAATPVLVHGHTHRPGDEQLAPGFERLVLSDWDLDHTPHRAEVLRLRDGRFARIAPEGLPARA